MKKTICLDFDGVCNTYDGWKGEDELFEPRPELGEFIRALIDGGKRVAIFSTRPADKLAAWCDANLPQLSGEVANGNLFFPDRKPPADCYVDDRAIRFNGSFADVLPACLNFKAFWEPKLLTEAVINHGDGSVIQIDEAGVVR